MRFLLAAAVLLLVTNVCFGYEENDEAHKLLKRLLGVLQEKRESKHQNLISDLKSKVVCSDVEKRCADGLDCYRISERCDDVRQCVDGSDEKNCDTYTCAAGTVACAPGKSKQCILKSERCDGKADCNYDADETDCGDKPKYSNPEWEKLLACKSDEFECFSNKKSICLYKPIYWCDGDEDCDDGMDEATCPDKKFKKGLSDPTRNQVIRALLKKLLKK